VPDAPIPLPNVTGKILQKVIEYCKYHKEHPTPLEDKKDTEKRTDDIIPWDQEFCKVDQATLFELILAANFLDIKPLLDLTCKTVANMIKGKTPEEIRKTFNIKNDFTPEEEEQVRREVSHRFIYQVQKSKWISHHFLPIVTKERLVRGEINVFFLLSSSRHALKDNVTGGSLIPTALTFLSPFHYRLSSSSDACKKTMLFSTKTK